MNPRRILELARRIRAFSNEENHRSVISRSYYSALNVANEMFMKMGCVRPNQDTHKCVQRRLLATNDAAFQQVSYRLAAFHGKRVPADYRMDDQKIGCAREADDALQEATELIAEFDACVETSPRCHTVQKTIKVSKVD